MIIYVDVLIFLNTLVTYFLILSVSSILKTRPGAVRLVSGSLFGGFCALAIFLPELNFLFDFMLKAAVCTLTTLITFTYKNRIRFVKHCLLMLAVSFVYAGAMLALWAVLRPPNMAVGNSVVYFNISPLLLICSTVACYLFIKLFAFLRGHTKAESTIYCCRVSSGGYSAAVTAIVDSGNGLCDPYFGTPVAVFSEKSLGEVAGNANKYLIPCKTVAGKSVIKAFMPDGFEIETSSGEKQELKVTVAVCESKVHNQFDGLLSPIITENFKEQDYDVVCKNQGAYK